MKMNVRKLTDATIGDKSRDQINNLVNPSTDDALNQITNGGIDESLTYMAFPRNHWTRIRTNNALERMNREIRRRTRVVGNFPDGRSALMLVSARLRHVAATQWGAQRYLDMDKLQNQNQRKEALEVVEA